VTDGIIAVAELFPVLQARLLDLLRSLDRSDWEKPTVAGAWTVKDIAAHLLDTQQRQLSRIRGEPIQSRPAIRSHADLVAWINRLNADGINRCRALEPPDLIALMEEGATTVADYYQSLDPFEDAPFPVSWAGETRSPNWFHLAREFTERWHHQQQIRLATERDGIMTRELYHPVLECFMRALPFAFRDKARTPGTIARVNVAGDCGGSWYLLHSGELETDDPAGADDRSSSRRHRWRLVAAVEGQPASETTIPQEIAWRVFTRGILREQAARQVRVDGDADLGYHVLDAIAIVA
jgi:uncharacterized protein (TIGR03083 family)